MLCYFAITLAPLPESFTCLIQAVIVKYCPVTIDILQSLLKQTLRTVKTFIELMFNDYVKETKGFATKKIITFTKVSSYSALSALYEPLNY